MLISAKSVVKHYYYYNSNVVLNEIMFYKTLTYTEDHCLYDEYS